MKISATSISSKPRTQSNTSTNAEVHETPKNNASNTILAVVEAYEGLKIYVTTTQCLALTLKQC